MPKFGIDVPSPFTLDCHETEYGPVHRVLSYLAAGERHGDENIKRLDSRCCTVIELFDHSEGWRTTDVERAVYIDTETTGLSRAAGTVAFMVGLGYWRGEQLVLEQLFLDDPVDEHAMLRFLQERLLDASCLVSYNGKSFDWALLESRFAMHKIPVERRLPHLDLLHVVRRLTADAGLGFRLAEVEARMLGFERVQDITSAEVPERYWAYLERRLLADVAPIFTHNAWDILSMVGLLGHLCQRCGHGDGELDASVSFALARYAERARRVDLAERFFSEASTAMGDVGARSLLALARLRRRRGDWEGARRLLHAGVARAEQDSLLWGELHLALSKLLEHQIGDPQAALRHALLSAGPESQEEQARRVERLRGKLERSGPRVARGRMC